MIPSGGWLYNIIEQLYAYNIRAFIFSLDYIDLYDIDVNVKGENKILLKSYIHYHKHPYVFGVNLMLFIILTTIKPFIIFVNFTSQDEIVSVT